MPHNYHLLPKHSQEILRIARMPPKIRKPAAPLEEDGGDVEDEEKPKEVQNGFPIKRLVKLDRDNGQEAPEPNYLAKRRRVTPTMTARQATVPLRETKVKKVDAEGNVSVFTALVPEGQSVPGEVLPADATLAEAVPAAAAPGTVVEGVGVVNAEGVVVFNDVAQQTPPRRRPVPAKKKGRRGKKKVLFAGGSAEQGTPASGSDRLTVPGSHHDGGSIEPSDGDTPMADACDEEDGEDVSEDDGEERGHSLTPASVEFRPESTEANANFDVGQALYRQPSPTALKTPGTGDLQLESTTQAPDAVVKGPGANDAGNSSSNTVDNALPATGYDGQTSIAQDLSIHAVELAMPAQGAKNNSPASSTPGLVSQPPAAQLPLGDASGSNFGSPILEQAASIQPTSYPPADSQTATAAADPSAPSTNQGENPPSPDLLGSLEAHLNQDM